MTNHGLTLLQRWWLHVEIQPDGCWYWTGSIDPEGYGWFSIDRKGIGAHRVGFLLFIDVLDPDLEIDHLCRVRRCVYPGHLEQVTHAVNMERAPGAAINFQRNKTHCKHGHRFTEENTYYYGPNNKRCCRACNRANQAKMYQNRKARGS